MSWAAAHIAKLARGETVQFRPVGNSMLPHVKSGALVTVLPAGVDDVQPGDIVLCKVKSNFLFHFVAARANGRVSIANARGRVNGWTHRVYGKCIKVEP